MVSIWIDRSIIWFQYEFTPFWLFSRFQSWFICPAFVFIILALGVINLSKYIIFDLKNFFWLFEKAIHCVKSVRIWSFSGPYFAAHSDWIWRDTEYLSVFNPNVGKYRPEKLRLRILFTQLLLLGLQNLTLSWIML